MPAPPEIGDGGSQVGVVEVLFIPEAHHQPHADGHVGVGGEVQIDLEGVGQAPQPQGDGGSGLEGGQILGLVRQGAAEDGLGGDGAAHVCQQHFLRQAGHKPVNAVAHVLAVHVAGEDLLAHVLVADDGPGDALMEQRDVQKQPPEFGLGRHLLAVHVHHVGQQLEGVEGDADGQGDLGHNLRPAEPAVGLSQQEGGVLKEGQQP